MMLSARTESTILSAPPAESMMLSAQGHAHALTLRARSQASGTESIILSAGGAESMMLHHPSYRCCQLSVDCCALGPKGRHLRPRTRPPLYFLMHLCSASQPREPATARANPLPGACNRLVGSRGTMIWSHGRRCCHEDRAKPLGVGRQPLLLFLCCVLSVVCVCDVFYLSSF